MSVATRLYLNHLAFIAAHRGEIINDDNFIAVNSEVDEYTYAVLNGQFGAAGLPGRYSTVHLFPGAEAEEAALVQNGFVQSGALSYMVLSGDTGSWPSSPAVTVVKAKSPEEFDLFSHVQAAGFTDNEDDYSVWHPFLQSSNRRNRGLNNQTFYIAYIGEDAVGVCLLLCSDDVASIYALTTLAGHRKKGVSTTVMKAAVKHGREAGDNVIALQVIAGSYAESMYERLGFEHQFKARIFNRKY